MCRSQNVWFSAGFLKCLIAIISVKFEKEVSSTLTTNRKITILIAFHVCTMLPMKFCADTIHLFKIPRNRLNFLQPIDSSLSLSTPPPHITSFPSFLAFSPYTHFNEKIHYALRITIPEIDTTWWENIRLRQGITGSSPPQGQELHPPTQAMVSSEPNPGAVSFQRLRHCLGTARRINSNTQHQHLRPLSPKA